jgi:biotin synthase-related radical SAM superfamily protein
LSTTQQLLTDLQSRGLRLVEPEAGAPSRRGGAGPTDHKAVTVDGRTIMVPVHTGSAAESPYETGAMAADGSVPLKFNGSTVARIGFPRQPRFYKMQTLDGVPYSKIAQLQCCSTASSTW